MKKKTTIAVTTMSLGAKPSSFHREADLPATVQVGIQPHDGLPEFIVITIADNGHVSVKRLQITAPTDPPVPPLLTAPPKSTAGLDLVPADLQVGRGRKTKKTKKKSRRR